MRKMNIIIYYSSLTGCTEKLASCVYRFLVDEGHEVRMIQNRAGLHPVSADYYIIAFWCRRSNMDDLSKALLSRLQGKKIFAMGTIGGDAAGAYGKRVETNVAEIISRENICLGAKICQGAIDLNRIRQRMTLPPDHPRYADQTRYEKALKTQGHPDHKDLNLMMDFCCNIISSNGETML